MNEYFDGLKETIFAVLPMISYKVLIRVVVVVGGGGGGGGVYFVQFLFNHSVFVFFLRWTSNR